MCGPVPEHPARRRAGAGLGAHASISRRICCSLGSPSRYVSCREPDADAPAEQQEDRPEEAGARDCPDAHEHRAHQDVGQQVRVELMLLLDALERVHAGTDRARRGDARPSSPSPPPPSSSSRRGRAHAHRPTVPGSVVPISSGYPQNMRRGRPPRTERRRCPRRARTRAPPRRRRLCKAGPRRAAGSAKTRTIAGWVSAG